MNMSGFDPESEIFPVSPTQMNASSYLNSSAMLDHDPIAPSHTHAHARTHLPAREYRLNEAPVFQFHVKEALRSGTLSLDQAALKDLARDLHTMQREAKDRAIELETEMRELSRELGINFDAEAFYTEAVGKLHGVDISQDPLGDDLTSHTKAYRPIDPAAQRKRKKKDNASSAHNANGTSAASNKQSQKEKQRQLKEHAEFVETWMTFPNSTNIATVKPMTVDTLLSIPSLGNHWQMEEFERIYREEREIELRAKEAANPSAKSNWSLALPTDSREEKELKRKERKKEAERKQREESKERKKLSELQRLGILHLEREQRKRVLNLQDNLGKNVASAFMNRILACLIEQPSLTAEQQQERAKRRPQYHDVVAANEHLYDPSSSMSFNSSNNSPTSSSSSKKRKKKGVVVEVDLSDRLRAELRSCGLDQLANIDVDSCVMDVDRTDDAVAAELRAAQQELKAYNETLNATRSSFYSLGNKISDHTIRLSCLKNAEDQLLHTAKHAKGKKRKPYEEATQKHTEAEKLYGTRRQITGFVPNPMDLGGMPRALFKQEREPPSYINVFMSQNLPPLPPAALAQNSTRRQTNAYGIQNEAYRSNYNPNTLLAQSSNLLTAEISPSLLAGSNYSPSNDAVYISPTRLSPPSPPNFSDHENINVVDLDSQWPR